MKLPRWFRRPSPAADDPYAETIQVELQRLYLRQAARRPWGILLLVPSLAWFAHGEVPWQERLGWACIVLMGLVLRVRAAEQALQRDPLSNGLGREVIRVTGLWVLAGLAAGAAPLFWMPLLPNIDRAIYSVGFCAWYAAAVVVSLVSPMSAFFFGAALLGPLAAAWSIHAGESGMLVGLICLLLLFFVRASVDDAYEAMRGSIRSRLREQSLARSLEERGRELVSAMRARTQFLAAASHDLRQPVTSLNLLVSALTAAKDERALRAVAGKLDAPLRALDEILSSLLEVSRLEAGTVRVEKRPFNLRDVVLEVQVEYTPRATAKGINLRSEAPNQTVVSDPDILRRILRNLVDNAIKFTDGGWVHVRGQADGSRVTLRVTDTGRGIPPDVRERVFDDYFQADNPQRDRRQGLGLGLSIVRRLVQLLEGTVAIESEPGSGTAFTVALPAALLEEASAPPERPKSQAFTWLGVGSALVVDDDPLVLEAFKELFDAHGVTARFATDASTCLDVLSGDDFAPDVAIVDFGLPGGVDGIDLIHQIRRRLPAAMALLVTGDTRPAILRRASEAGIPVVHKPFTADEFAARLQSARAAH